MNTRAAGGLLLGLLLGASPLFADVLYSVTDLGMLPGLTASSAIAINEAGQVAGTAYVSTANGFLTHAFLYSNGQMTDLGPGSANGLNNVGQVVGSSSASNGAQHAFLYSNGQMQDLGTLPGYPTSYGTAINNAGQITGFVSTSSRDASSRAFLYSNGQMQDLGTLPGFASSSAIAINEAGQVAGSLSVGAGGPTHVFLYSNGQIRDLGVGTASGINNAGHIVGGGFLYSNGQMIDLGGLSGNLGGTQAYGLNDAGQIVGFSRTSTGTPHAFLYSNGQMNDLNDLIAPGQGVTLGTATAINDHGQIVALGDTHSYLLTPTATPVPEPSTLALFGVALLGLGVLVRASKS